MKITVTLVSGILIIGMNVIAAENNKFIPKIKQQDLHEFIIQIPEPKRGNRYFTQGEEYFSVNTYTRYGTMQLSKTELRKDLLTKSTLYGYLDIIWGSNSDRIIKAHIVNPITH